MAHRPAGHKIRTFRTRHTGRDTKAGMTDSFLGGRYTTNAGQKWPVAEGTVRQNGRNIYKRTAILLFLFHFSSVKTSNNQIDLVF
jgi:hypothetical protein